jgi:hypothetical protein
MTARYFSVVNYDQQQHYKDRGPTWIKLYNRLLDDYAFAMQPDAAKWHLIGIFLIASRHHNRIPADPVWLARQIGATAAIELEPLERAGFIAWIEDVGGAFDLFANPASPEKREENKEEKNREEKTLLSGMPDMDGSGEEGRGKKKKYPEDFENFWKSYPTDSLMSKAKAFDQWRRMAAADKCAAQAAIPAFRDFIKARVNYRTVHAQRYLSERRYEGFAEKPEVDAEALAAAKDRADRLMKRGKYKETYE